MCTGGTDGVWYRWWSHKRFTELSDSPLLTILDEGFIHDIFGDPIFPLSQLVDEISYMAIREFIFIPNKLLIHALTSNFQKSFPRAFNSLIGITLDSLGCFRTPHLNKMFYKLEFQNILSYIISYILSTSDHMSTI